MDYEPLWAKASSYMERALLAERDSDIFPVLGSLALEFIARAALASVHPALLAATRDGSVNLLYAFGFAPKMAQRPFVPKSVDIEEAFSRCEQIIPDFTKELRTFCSGMTGRRNEELHSGGLPFEHFPNSLWLPRFYEACNSLLVFQKKTINDLLGDEEASAAGTMLRSIADEAAKKVKGLIHAYLEAWKLRAKRNNPN